MFHRYSVLVIGVVAASGLPACGREDATLGGESPSIPAAAPKMEEPAADIAAIPDGYVHVPGGKMAHVDCIHEIPEGGSVDPHGNVTLHGKLVAHFEPCTRKTLRGKAITAANVRGGVRDANPNVPAWGGWVESSWAYASTIQGMAEFNHMNSGNWVVPAAPSTNDNQIIYLFPSFQSSRVIVQPVLQWGATTAGGQGVFGGAYWTYAAWVETDGTFYHSQGITVNAGDTLNGWMDLGDKLGANYDWWAIGRTDVTTGQSMGSGFWVAPATFNTAQGGVLEVYGMTACSDFPATGFTVFGTPLLTQAGPTWSTQNYVNPTWYPSPNDGYNGPDCGFSVSASAANGTSLVY